VTADGVEVTGYPDHRKYRISGVPKTVVGENHESSARAPSPCCSIREARRRDGLAAT
jgi:hypothetical protein